MKVLLVEDNVRLAERISYKLRDSFIVDVSYNGLDALERIGRIDYAVIILDLGLPDIPGATICENIRDINTTVPIMILTGAHEVAHRVELLAVGADDFMSKPFDILELKARLAALTRRKDRPQATTRLTYKDLVIDAASHTVTREGIAIALRRKEFDILHYLISNEGRIVTRQMIMNQVWSADSGSWVSTVDVHMKHLRDKVDKPFGEKYIKTVYGIGYKIEVT